MLSHTCFPIEVFHWRAIFLTHPSLYYTADGDLKSPLKNPDQTYRDKLEQDLNTVSTISKLTESVSVPHQVRVHVGNTVFSSLLRIPIWKYSCSQRPHHHLFTFLIFLLWQYLSLTTLSTFSVCWVRMRQQFVRLRLWHSCAKQQTRRSNVSALTVASL